MKICKKCAKLVSYNSYFGGYYCTSCGQLEIVHPESYPKVSSLSTTKSVRYKKMVAVK